MTTLTNCVIVNGTNQGIIPTQTNSTFFKPLRSDVGTHLLNYDNSTGEITYGPLSYKSVSYVIFQQAYGFIAAIPGIISPVDIVCGIGSNYYNILLEGYLDIETAEPNFLQTYQITLLRSGVDYDVAYRTNYNQNAGSIKTNLATVFSNVIPGTYRIKLTWPYSSFYTLSENWCYLTATVIPSN